MNIGLAPISGTIFAGNSKSGSKNTMIWIGNPDDVTDEAIRAVFDWFVFQYTENEPNIAYQVRYTNCNYVLTMTKEG